ncbi:hypothetical protein yc1106_08541 [Curvularia clavata]|uniref:Proline dehydrogenase n=1 Tax=Curvularia clavata TaxID=95742 RepID=A0A9Q8ZDH5_CURCL|nr:hypothetical protein yc1106_08541 [Curvularia clavata]
MPTSMLLRSLFIATISSTKALLIPSLHLLSFLSKPNRGFLFNIERNPILKAVLKSTVYKQFCGGETAQETKACVKQLKDLGFKGVILTYAREIVFDHRTEAAKQNESKSSGIERAALPHDADIEAWRAGTLETLDLISEGDILAIKQVTTGAGPTVSAAFSQGQLPPPQMMSALDELATICTQRGIQVIVDAESQHWQHGIARTTVELMRKFNRHGKATIYNTYQAYLKETSAVILQHMAEAEKHNFTLGLKLVRGAYILSENRALIHDTKEDTDKAYDTIAQGALRQHLGVFGGQGPHARPFPSLNLLLASHNRHSVMAAAALHRQRVEAGLPTVPVAYGQLQGNLGTPILSTLLSSTPTSPSVQFTHYTACVASPSSETRLSTLFAPHTSSGKLSIARVPRAVRSAISTSDVVILAVDPSQVEALVSQPDIKAAFHRNPPTSSCENDQEKEKLVISVIAGLSVARLTTLLSPSVSTSSSASPSPSTLYIVRALPNVCAQVSHSLTTIELPAPSQPILGHLLTTATFALPANRPSPICTCFPHGLLQLARGRLDSRLSGGVIVDAMVDAGVAVGMPRDMAQKMICSSMRGSAEMMMQEGGGLQPSGLRDIGTSPAGSTIAGIMVLEEMGVRAGVGKALRESVRVAREMGKEGGAGEVADDVRRA